MFILPSDGVKFNIRSVPANYVGKYFILHGQIKTNLSVLLHDIRRNVYNTPKEGRGPLCIQSCTCPVIFVKENFFCKNILKYFLNLNRE